MTPAAFQPQDPAKIRENRRGVFTGRGCNSPLNESSVEDGPEIGEGEGSGDRPPIDEEKRGPPGAGLLAQPDVCPNMVVPPSALDAVREPGGIQPFFLRQAREERVGILAVPPAALLGEKAVLHSEEHVLLTGALPGRGGLEAIGEHAQDEGDVFPLHQTGFHIDVEEGGEGLLVEAPAVSATEVADLHDLHRSIVRAEVIPHIGDLERLLRLLVGGDPWARGWRSAPALGGLIDDGPDDGVGLGKLGLYGLTLPTTSQGEGKKEAEAQRSPAAAYEIQSGQKHILVKPENLSAPPLFLRESHWIPARTSPPHSLSQSAPGAFCSPWRPRFHWAFPSSIQGPGTGVLSILNDDRLGDLVVNGLPVRIPEYLRKAQEPRRESSRVSTRPFKRKPPIQGAVCQSSPPGYRIPSFRC